MSLDTGNANQPSAEHGERAVRRLQRKVNAYFQRAQQVYNGIPKVGDKNVKIEAFLASATSIDLTRSGFLEALDELNEALVNSEQEPSYDSMVAFEGVYSAIKFSLTEISSTRNLPESSEGTSSKRESKMEYPKLPRLDIPSFNGDIQTWPMFYETFRTVIHENNDLNDTFKMQFLIGKLVGKAQVLCQGYLPSGENYDILWNALISKYNDKRFLAASYVDGLMGLPSVSEANPAGLEDFIDKFSSLISSLRMLNLKSIEDFIFIHVASKKIGLETVKAFEMSFNDPKSLPTCSQFVEFVRNQAHILQRAHNVSNARQIPPPPYSGNAPRKNIATAPLAAPRHPAYRASNNPVTKTFVSVNQPNQCAFCGNSDHFQLTHCAKFKSISPQERFNFVKSHKYCGNCLNSNHTVRNCSSHTKCEKCSRAHNSLLHFESEPGSSKNCSVSTAAVAGDGNRRISPDQSNRADPLHPASGAAAAVARAPIMPTVSLCALDVCVAESERTTVGRNNTVLLGTAECNVVDEAGNISTVRVLLDNASQRNLITSECLERLKLKLHPAQMKGVSGVGDVTNPIEGVTCLTLRSRYDDSARFTIQPYVVQCITNALPTATIDVARLDYLNNIPLADYTYATPSKIDLILGADFVARIQLAGKVSRSTEEPVAIQTLLGYVIFGQAPILGVASGIPRAYCTFDRADSIMNRFFELEDVPKASLLTPDERECETIFQETTKRDESGRYTVVLPFKQEPSQLGDSLKASTRRYVTLERKLSSDPSVKIEYDNVFKEYLQKGYLAPVDKSENTSDSGSVAPALKYVIPHHAVVRYDKSTTRLRVVMDASMKSSSGLSLNDLLHTGPNLQNDLFDIILKFRQFSVAISADIRQMYMQILMDDQCKRFQRVLYRFDPNEPLREFELTRVPFGLCCSPYLAIRTVRQLAADERSRFPIAAPVAERDIYMDDIVTSCSQSSEGIELSDQLIKLFHAGGFDLVKFSSNSPEVMSSIPPSHRVSEEVEFSPENYLKILGLQWLPAEDAFAFTVNIQPRECTKRNILSTIARLWDLMGFVAPVTLLAKLIIKSLWTDNIGWDDTPPQDIITLWTQFESELPALQAIRIQRHVGVTTNCVVTVLGFADASEKAYGGVVYLHVYFPEENRFQISLVCAKSRVAPLRCVSLARLELCGNMILARLMRIVIDSYSQRCQINRVFAFTDSTVALAWIHSSPARWQTFVANRVAKIQDDVASCNFFHIPGKDNPADCLSRGLMPSQLSDHPLWFSGPRFAQLPVTEWPIVKYDPTNAGEVPETKPKVLVSLDLEPPVLYSLALKISSWPKLLRIVMYVLRFAKKLPKKFEVSHLESAELAVIKDLQQVHFASELKNAQSGKVLPPAFQKLKAFLHNGIFRVGGRLSNADLDYDSQHPILLPGRDHVVDIIIDYYHRKNLHTGPQLLMSLLRQKYWILAARNVVRKRVQICNVCFRANPRNGFPEMAALPASRVLEAKAFCHTGVDYAGPLPVIPFHRRGVRSQKGYLCLFVCLVTKAVHIELAVDLSTESFLNALKRFLARRGPVAAIYSDNGTNFIGAKSYLDNMYELLASEKYVDKFANELRENCIEWKFNPPYAPHFGGIWESNIKSVKMHLNKVVGNLLLTFEEMQTVLAQIEAILNSRPLSVLSSDPSEPMALTPSHFLTLTPLKSLPSETIAENASPVSLLRRKRMVDSLVQGFWRRWRIEYLNTLQSRNKWLKPTDSIKEGTVVILKSDNSAPLDWPLGVVDETFAGKDGVVRVVSVRTRSGVYRRPVVKVFPLPSQ